MRLTMMSDYALRVLLFAGGPSREYQFVRTMLYREVLESIIEPLLEASAPFNQPGLPAEVLKAYIRSKIRIFTPMDELPFGGLAE